MRLGAQPFLWKWVLFAWEWKMISISKAEHLPSFWNRGPEELGNGLLAPFASPCRHCYFWVSFPTNDTFCVLLPEASLLGLVRSVVHGKHIRPYAGKPSETEWIRTRERCHHYNQSNVFIVTIIVVFIISIIIIIIIIIITVFIMITLVSLRNRKAERRGRQNVCVWKTWKGYYLRVLSYFNFLRWKVKE